MHDQGVVVSDMLVGMMAQLGKKPGAFRFINRSRKEQLIEH